MHTSTHSLQIHTRLEPSNGLEISASTSSWVLLQNEHLGISSTLWRLGNMSPVWLGSSGIQDPLKFNLALLTELRLCCFSKPPKDAAARSQKIGCLRTTFIYDAALISVTWMLLVLVSTVPETLTLFP